MTAHTVLFDTQSPILFEDPKTQDILLDCDGVLVDYTGPFGAFCENVLGIRVDPAGPASYDMVEWLGLENRTQVLELIERFNAGENGAFRNLPALPGAKRVLHKLHARGHRIRVITTCSDDFGVYLSRRSNLLEAFGPVFHSLECLGLHDSKRNALKSYRPGLWVEDLPTNAMIGADVGHQSFVMRARHNKAAPERSNGAPLTWADSWDHMEKLLKL